jgi:hypothetical protein
MLKLEASSFIQDEYCLCNVPKHIVSEVELGWSLWIGHLDYPLFHLQLKRSHCIEQNIALHNHTSLFVKPITQKGTQGELWAPLRCSFSEARETNDKQWMCSLCNRFLLLPFMQERSQPVCVSSQVYHSAPPICQSGHSFPSAVWHYPVSIVSALTLFLQSANPMPSPCKDQSS